MRSTSACTGHDVLVLVYEAYSGGSPLLHAFKYGRGLRTAWQSTRFALSVGHPLVFAVPPSSSRSPPNAPYLHYAPFHHGRPRRELDDTHYRQPQRPVVPLGRGNRARRYHYPLLRFHVHPSPPRHPRGRPHSLRRGRFGTPPAESSVPKRQKPVASRPAWGPAVPRGLRSVRGGAPAFKQLVRRCVDQGGNERAGRAWRSEARDLGAAEAGERVAGRAGSHRGLLHDAALDVVPKVVALSASPT